MVKRFPVSVPLSDHQSETRTGYLYLPVSYEADRHTRYPVLYMFDGHNVFFDSDATYGKSWGLSDYLDRHRIPLIVAAVECNHSADHGRLKEYAPFSFTVPDVGYIQGQGAHTMNWLIHTFKAEIDHTYRTLSDREHTFIAGSSMGGLMSLYALLVFPSVFSRAASLSPSLWIDPEQVLDMIQGSPSYFGRIPTPPILYMDYGSEEFSHHPEADRIFSKAAVGLFQKGIFLDCRIVPGGTHCEASWERQIPFFLNALLYR